MKTFEYLLLCSSLVFLVSCTTPKAIENQVIQSNVQTPYGTTGQINNEVNTIMNDTGVSLPAGIPI
jgi:hypothetical protein